MNIQAENTTEKPVLTKEARENKVYNIELEIEQLTAQK